MKQEKIEYTVTNISTGKEFQTSAVSESDAINHIHFNLWFKKHIWTEMNDFVAEPTILIHLRELLKEKPKNEVPEYHQYSLFEGCL